MGQGFFFPISGLLQLTDVAMRFLCLLGLTVAEVCETRLVHHVHDSRVEFRLNGVVNTCLCDHYHGISPQTSLQSAG